MDDICQEQFLELSYLNGVPEPTRGRGVPVRGRGAAPPPPPPVPRYRSQHVDLEMLRLARSGAPRSGQAAYLRTSAVSFDLGF